LAFDLGIGLLASDSPASIKEKAEKAEEVGYTSVWMGERGPESDVFGAARIAASSTRLTVGVGVLSPFLHPAEEIGEELAGLIQSYGNRFILALAPGDSFVLRQAGVRPRRPWEKMLSCRKGVLGLLGSRGLSCAVYIGAQGPRMLRASEGFDGVLLNFVNPLLVEWALGKMSCPAQVRAWGPALITRRRLRLAERRLRTASAVVASSASDEALRLMGVQEEVERIRTFIRPPRSGVVGRLVSERVVASFSLRASPEEAAETMRRYMQLGLRGVVLGYPQCMGLGLIGDGAEVKKYL